MCYVLNGLLHDCVRLTSLKVEAGTGLEGPGLGPGVQTGVVACRGQLG